MTNQSTPDNALQILITPFLPANQRQDISNTKKVKRSHVSNSIVQSNNVVLAEKETLNNP